MREKVVLDEELILSCDTIYALKIGYMDELLDGVTPHAIDNGDDALVANEVHAGERL